MSEFGFCSTETGQNAAMDSAKYWNGILDSIGIGQNAAMDSAKHWNGILDCIKVGIIGQLRMFKKRPLFGSIWTNYLLLTTIFLYKSVASYSNLSLFLNLISFIYTLYV
jgi:hypothetical protein